MTQVQSFGDKTAMSLSFLCTLHCLALPLALLVIPSLASLPFADERFHTWLLMAVIPISALTLTMGCRKHKQLSVVSWGVVGIVLLIVGGVFAHDWLGELAEKLFTLSGAGFVAFSHYKNQQLCKKNQFNCADA
jgi:hypothetical protein